MDLVLLDHANPSFEGDLTVAFTDEAFDGATSNSVRAEDYEPANVVNDDDFDRLREWLEGHIEHDGIDVGSLIQNTFIDLFGHEFIRQARTIKQIVKTESPSRIIVETDPAPIYNWNMLGDGRLIPGLASSIASSYECEFAVHVANSFNLIKDRLFRIIGPTSLRSLDWLTNGVSRWAGDSPPNDSDVVAFIFSPNNMGVVVPVVEELATEYSVTVVVQSHGFTNFKSNVFSRLEGVNAQVVAAERYTPFESYANDLMNARKLRSIHESTNQTAKPFLLDGIDIGDGLTDRQWLYDSLQFPRIMRYIDTCSQIIDREEPETVLLKNDGPLPTRTMSTVAQKKGVPSVLIQHGIEAPDRRYVPISEPIAVWGTHWQEVLEKKGVNRSKTVVTGGPQFDHLAKYQSSSRSSIRRDLGLDSSADKLIVTLASQPFEDRIRRRLVDTAVEAVTNVNGVTLVLRPHPRESNDLHREVADKYENVRVKSDCDIHPLLFATDVLLAVRSTVILEASLLNRPVVILDISSKKPPLESFSEETGFTTIQDAESLRNHIRECISSNKCRESLMANQPKFDGDFAIGADGLSASRVASIVSDRIHD